MDLPVNMKPKIIVSKPSHIIREVPPGGQILVRHNQELTPSDVIGKHHQIGGFRSVNMATDLKINPKDIKKYLKREVGKTIYKDELLAEKKELFGTKEIKAPTDAVIESIDEKAGVVILRLLPKEISVISGVFGIVDFIDAQTGMVHIKALLTVITGVAGSGKQRGGVLKIIGNEKTITLDKSIIGDVHQSILVTGALIYIEALRKALSGGAAGVISGGINARDYKTIMGSGGFQQKNGTDMGISLLIEQGFGGIPISDEVFKELWKYENKFVYIDGNNRKVMLPSEDPDSIIKLRSIMLPIIQTGVVESSYSQFTTLSIGNKIRSIWPPYMGSIGTVINIDQSPTVLESGVATYLVTVEIAKQKLKLPYTNIEVVG